MKTHGNKIASIFLNDDIYCATILMMQKLQLEANNEKDN